MLIRARAPLRISFAGGGTDVPPFPAQEGGCVLNATINKHSYGALHPCPDSRIHIESLDFGAQLDYDPTELSRYDGTMALVQAAVRKIKAPDSEGFSLFLHSDVPPGTGLGSSSSMMVTLVGLLKEHENLPLSNYEIAEMAFAIERKELGIEGGYQDQYAATFGGLNFMEFTSDRVIVNPLRIGADTLNELEHNLLLCYTGGTRLSARIIEDQVARYERSEPSTVGALRELKQIAQDMKRALLQGRLNDFAELMSAAWQSKQRLSDKIVTPRVAEMHEAALKAGALGGKLSGAGGGGFLMFYCPFEKKHKVAAVLKQMGGVVTDFAFEPSGLQTWRIQENRA
ncbi:MAG: GHMP kinase [candidate division WOR-3 bacterium]